MSQHQERVVWRVAGAAVVVSELLVVPAPPSPVDEIVHEAVSGLALETAREVARRGRALGFVCGRTPASGPRAEPAFARWLVQSGVAAQVNAVTRCLIGRRDLGEPCRRALSVAYPALLADFLQRALAPPAARLSECLADPARVADAILVALGREGGPLDRFAGLLVQAVVRRKHINVDDHQAAVLQREVRAAL